MTSSQYNIPSKGSITIRQLLSHAAGVFDVTTILYSSIWDEANLLTDQFPC